MNKTAILQALEAYLAEHNLSANELAKKSGINAGYISAMRNGKDTILVKNKEVIIETKWYEKLAKFIGYAYEKTYWAFRPTSEALRILASLEDAKAYGYTNVIVGESGCGKTYVSKLFLNKNPKDTYLITVGSSDNIGDLIDKVVDELKIISGKTRSKKIQDIVKHLKKSKFEGGSPLLIFDESEYMKQAALCAMKELYDHLQGVCGLVLIGTNQLTENLEKLRKKNKPGIPQFYRRIKFGIRVLPGIDKTFKQFLNGISDSGLVRFLRQQCDNYGELHDVIVPAMREADRTGEELNENFVRKILNFNS